jgi:hypothetical protein
MASVTLSRASTSIDIPLIEEGGTALFSTDFGKPFATVRDSGGSVDPRVQDNWSAQINHTLAGRFTSGSAYQDAIALADLVKADNNGNDLELSSIPFSEYPDPMLVAPQAGNEQALTITYPPGYSEYVELQLGLTEISTSLGSPDRDTATPTASGTGPIELSAGGNTVPITAGVQVERSIGRPNDSATRSQDDLGRYIYKHKVAHDSFSLSFELTENTIANLQVIADDIFKQQLGRDGMTLNFNGVYGLGEFDVLPTGSAPVRYQRLAGRTGQVSLPTLNFRVITTGT